MYTVGQIRDKTGVSIRTLHYYEKLGLLSAVRNESGYRLYNDSSIVRLQQIMVLKKMRFTLQEIGAFFKRVTGNEDAALAEVWNNALQQQIDIVKQEQQKLQTVHHLLQSTHYAITATGKVNTEELLAFIREIDAFPEPDYSRRAHFFTEQEQAALPGQAMDDPLTLEWAHILNALQTCMHEPPDSPSAQQLAARIVAYGRQLFGEDEQLLEKYWDYITPSDDAATVKYGMTREVMDYIVAITDIYQQS